jgi:hypothetical protein
VTGRLLPADDLLATAVRVTLDELKLDEADQAATRLAKTYARTIDAAEDPQDALEKLGPKLLAVLESLGATPAARARIKAGGGPPSRESRIAAIRAARR